MTSNSPGQPGITRSDQDAEHFLHMRHVNVALGDRIVLHDINLTIQAGEHVAILGANGCGKSTLIRTMTCELYPIIPDHGQPSPEVASSAAAAGT
jgi:iron complex transport system ATP-binding protein